MRFDILKAYVPGRKRVVAKVFRAFVMRADLPGASLYNPRPMMLILLLLAQAETVAVPESAWPSGRTAKGTAAASVQRTPRSRRMNLMIRRSCP